MNRISFKPGQVCRWQPAAGFELDGQPVYIVGTNYVARHVCTNFWEDWRPDVVEADLQRIAAAGLNAVRIPIHWEYAEPAPGQYRPEMFARLAQFLEMARRQGLLVMPWFLVGVATRDYDVAWRGRDSFFSERMTGLAAGHLRACVARFRDAPNILCWDICDEPEWFSRHPGAEQLPYDPERIQGWLEKLCGAIKVADPQRAATLGFGHIANGNYGMDLRRAARTLDVMAVTAYPPHAGEDLLNGFRSGWFLGWSVRLNDCAGKGVFTCEAPGWSDIDASEAVIAAYYRVALFSNLANGSRGVLPWVWNDFDDAIQHLPPMDKYTTEKRFGISRADGRLKPAGEELQHFAGFVSGFPPDEWPSVVPEAGVLVPAIQPWKLHEEFRPLFHHYILLRQAGLRVQYVWPEDLDNFQGALLFLPESAAVPLLTETWMKLQGWVERGGTLVSTNRHTSSVFNALFGVELEGHSQVAKDIIFSKCLGDFKASERLALPAGGSSYQVARPAGAEVLIRDQAGRPLVTRQALGKGQAFLVAYAPETALAGLPPEELGGHGAHMLFRAFGRAAGLGCPVTCADPRIELDVRRQAGGRLLTILVNHSRFPVQTVLGMVTHGRPETLKLDGNGVLWRMFPAPCLPSIV